MRNIIITLLVVTNIVTFYLFYRYSHPHTSCQTDSFYAINYNDAQTLIENYMANQFCDINPADGTVEYDIATMSNSLLNAQQNTRSIWYSINQLQDFIDNVRSCSYANGISTRSLGIRFYFAAYPATPNWNNPMGNCNLAQPSNIDHLQPTSPTSAGKLTLLLIPTCNQTGTTATQNDADYNPLANQYLSASDCIYGNPISNTGGGVSTAGNGSTIMAMNHGGSIPPPYYPNPNPDSERISSPHFPIHIQHKFKFK